MENQKTLAKIAHLVIDLELNLNRCFPSLDLYFDIIDSNNFSLEHVKQKKIGLL